MSKYEIMLTVFSEVSYAKNMEFRVKNKIASIYCSPIPISRTIEKEKTLFVLEADNTNNRIRGIGIIKNRAKTRNIYEDEELQKHNGYVYTGKYHILREEIQPNSEEDIIFQALDYLCFYGKSHTKRYQGIQRFPQKWIDNLRSHGRDLVDIIFRMFSKKKMMVSAK